MRRLLPLAERRAVGPWCFVDHFGPARLAPPSGSVGPHPHIGLQTLTWLYAGAIEHGDSLGSRQRIVPGQVNLMTAGRGIVHWELTADGPPREVHGVQLWIALPDADRFGPPAFQHLPTLPTFHDGAFRGTVLIGALHGARSPADARSPIVGVDLVAPGPGDATLRLEPSFEHAVVVTEGTLWVDEEAAAPGETLFLPTGRDAVALRAERGGRAMLLGGAPLDAPLLIWWNFVARTHDEIAAARARWMDGAGNGFGDRGDYPSPAIPAPPLPPSRLLPR